MVLSIVHLWSALRWQPWISEAVVTFRTHEEQHHPGLLPLRLVLIEHGTECISVEKLYKTTNKMFHILFVAAPWTCNIRVCLRLLVAVSPQDKNGGSTHKRRIRTQICRHSNLLP